MDCHVTGIGDCPTRPGPLRMTREMGSGQELAVRTRTVALETRLSLREAADLVTVSFTTMKGQVATLEAAAHPVDGLDAGADLAVVGRRPKLINGWAVQVYLYDLGDSRGVELVASGRNGAVRGVRGARTRASFRRSVRRMDSLVAELRARDPRAQLIS